MSFIGHSHDWYLISWNPFSGSAKWECYKCTAVKSKPHYGAEARVIAS